MVTLTTPTPRNTDAPVMEPKYAEAAVITPGVSADMTIAEESAGVFAPVHRDNLLVTMVKKALAFYDWLSGPPMSQRERARREVAEVPGGRSFQWATRV